MKYELVKRMSRRIISVKESKSVNILCHTTLSHALYLLFAFPMLTMKKINKLKANMFPLLIYTY